GSMRTSEPAPAARVPGQNLWDEAREGLHSVLAHPMLRRTLVAGVAFEFFDSGFSGLYVLFVTRELGVAPATFGVILALGGIGGVVGAIAAGQAARWFGMGPVLVGGLLLAGLGNALIPWAASAPTLAVPVVASGELLVVLGVTLFAVNENTLRQIVTPD